MSLTSGEQFSVGLLCLNLWRLLGGLSNGSSVLPLNDLFPESVTFLKSSHLLLWEQVVLSCIYTIQESYMYSIIYMTKIIRISWLLVSPLTTFHFVRELRSDHVSKYKMVAGELEFP